MNEMTETQKVNLVRDFLYRYAKIPWDAIKLAGSIKKRYGINFDWHFTSAVLDSMNTKGEAEVTRISRGGVTTYRILLDEIR